MVLPYSRPFPSKDTSRDSVTRDSQALLGVLLLPHWECGSRRSQNGIPGVLGLPYVRQSDVDCWTTQSLFWAFLSPKLLRIIKLYSSRAV